MVSGKFKSRTFRRVYRKAPGGRTVLHYVLRKPGKPICGKCGQVLIGIAANRTTKFRNGPKNRRTVSRPYGGNLCSKCMRETIKLKIIKQ
jgi:large subunit ribosomal protein L34e